MRPTEQQIEVHRLFNQGESMAIDAGAGTGKTSTLRLLAYGTKRKGQYVAFNKSIVTDVEGRLPERCAASTAHSLAFRAVGRRYARRLKAPRMRSHEIASRLGLRDIFLRVADKPKTLSAGFLGGLVMRTVTHFCQSADTEPGVHHFPYIDGIDLPDIGTGRRTWSNNEMVREQLLPIVEVAWADLISSDGYLQFKHEHYLKLWQLSDPFIPADYVLFDEAQDANPVMAAIVAAQTHAQQVYCGDENQAIYEWMGAVNAMAGFAPEHRRPLTQSFRFGPAIAARANRVLKSLGSPLVLQGLDSIPSRIGPLEQPRAILCRTNAKAVMRLLDWKSRGVSPHLVGNGTEVAAFARAAKELQTGGLTGHPELACFNSWGEVEEYVRADVQGDELKLLVDLINEHGVDLVIEALDEMPREADAEMVVSTAHKAKGREWQSVQLADDFAMVPDDPPELRLRYVAFTRAREVLDDTVLRSPLTKATAGGPR